MPYIAAKDFIEKKRAKPLRVRLFEIAGYGGKHNSSRAKGFLQVGNKFNWQKHEK